MQVKHVTGIRLATGGALQHQRHLAVGHGLLGEIVVNDQRVHAVVHEPFAHRRAGERRKILVGGRIRGGRHHDDCVFERAGFFEHANHVGDVRLLLADGDVNRVERAVILVAGRFGRLVQPGLRDDGVDADGRLAGRAVANDQLALAAADRDHRVDGHDAGLHGLADGFPLHDAGRDFFHRVLRAGRDRPLAIDRLAERVDDAAEQPLAHGHGQQLAGGPDLLTFLDAGVLAEDDRADLGFFEVQREADDAVAEVEHLVEHRVGQPFDLGHTVADFAHDADVLLVDRGLDARDLGFDFLK